MKKRKRGEEGADEARGQQTLPPSDLQKPNPDQKREKAKTAELSRRLQVTFLTNVSIEMTRKCRGVANSTLRADLLMKRTRSLKA
jgi:hypothetical protein